MLMLRRTKLAVLMICMVQFSCNPVQKKASLNQAKQIFSEVSSLEVQLNEKLKTLVQRKNSINIQGRILTPREMEFIDEIELLEDHYFEWKKAFKDSSQDLDSDIQASNQNVPAKQILNTQERLKANIVLLKEKVDLAYQSLSKESANSL